MRYAFTTKNKQKAQESAFFIPVGVFISPFGWLSLRAAGPTLRPLSPKGWKRSRRPAAIKMDSAFLEFPDRWQYVKLTNVLKGFNFCRRVIHILEQDFI